MPGLGHTIRRTAIAAAALGSFLAAGDFAMAQNYQAMSCSQLWYARNTIYSQNGYCFKTAKARSVFGKGCFPPYGKLSRWEQHEVDNIQYWERYKGC